MNLDGRRKNSSLEDVGELAHFLPRALESLLLGYIIDAVYFGKLANVLHRRGDAFYVGAVT